MEVAVADVADDRRDQARGVEVGLGLGDALGEAADRHAGVGGEARARPAAARGRRRRRRGGRATARGARTRRPPRRSPGRRASRRSRSTSARLRLDLGRAAVELEEQRRRDRLVQPGVAVDGVDLDVVEQLDPGDGDAVGQHLDHAVDGVVELGNAHGRRGHRLGRRLQAQRGLGDQPERALGADEQPREVVAGRRLAGARARAHDLAVGVDHGEREDVLAHRAVAHRGRPGRAGGDHPADRRVRAGVDGEEHALGPQPVVERPARDAGLHGHVHVLHRQAQDAVHLARVDAHAAVERGDVALERRAGAERDDRRAVVAAGAHDRGGLLGVAREHDHVGVGGRVPGLVACRAGGARRRR